MSNNTEGLTMNQLAERNAQLVTENEYIRKRFKELEARPLCVKLPDTLRAFITDDDIKALDRFVECCEDPDAGGHDLRSEQVQRLVSIGILRKSGRNYHETTDFGDFVLSLGGSVEGSE